MKQQPTKEQWDELNKEQKYKLIGSIESLNSLLKAIKMAEPNKHNGYGDSVYTALIGGAFGVIGIGQMIEFLGDDWIDVFTAEDTMAMNEVEDLNESLYVLIDNAIKNPCDELWQAVKNKLCQK